ncbi:MAG: (2Fe-2S)-binding protein [Nannocystaceae bacterium]
MAVEPRVTLLQALRLDAGVIDLKQVCDRGACGACTVLVDGVPRNSCMMLAHDVAGANVTTVEGLADGERPSALQAAFVEHDALQCGFCTSGMLMSCTALLRRSGSTRAPLRAEQVQAAIAGNLCRCGTYPNIVAAVCKVAGSKPEGGA